MAKSPHPVLRFLALATLSIALGLGSAALAVRAVSRQGTLHVGSWTTSTTVGSESAGMYERAAVAIHALFVLNRSETVYYRAYTDDSGRPLDGGPMRQPPG